MELAGKALMKGSPEVVWAALFDPAVLNVCIPGCKSVERQSDSDFALTMFVKVGPFKANFLGTIKLEDPIYPSAVTLSGAMQGVGAGFTKGQARISLIAGDQGTELEYLADMKIGGKLAAVGDRLFGAAVKRNITDFFAGLESHLQGCGQGS